MKSNSMDAQELIVRKTAISENIVAFCRYLRQHGFVIGPAEEAEALRAIEVLAPYELAGVFSTLFENSFNPKFKGFTAIR